MELAVSTDGQWCQNVRSAQTSKISLYAVASTVIYGGKPENLEGCPHIVEIPVALSDH